MYKHEVCINPLNAGMSAAMNGFTTFVESEYASTTDRKILFTEPYKSIFKMKSVNATPFIEPAFFGVKLGDYFEVEFELMKISGNPNFTVQMGQIGANGTNVVVDIHTINASEVKTYFKKFKLLVPIRNNVTLDALGVFINLRTTINNTELILKNVKINVYTHNSSFKATQDLIVYNHKNDYLRVINTYSKTDIRNYKSIKTAYTANEITLPNETTFKAVSSANTFKGLIAKPNSNYYGNSIALMVEYKTNNATSLRATLIQIRKDGTANDGATYTFSDTSGAYVKKLIYLPLNAINDNFRGKENILEIGWLGACDFEIKQLIISNHQHDDFVDVNRCGINSLESWFLDINNVYTPPST